MPLNTGQLRSALPPSPLLPRLSCALVVPSQAKCAIPSGGEVGVVRVAELAVTRVLSGHPVFWASGPVCIQLL